MEFLTWSHLANAARRLSERRISPIYGLVLLPLFLGQVFNVVNEEVYSLKFLRLWCLSAIFEFPKHSQVVFRVKKRSPGGFNLSFLPWISRMIASTVISLVVYITAVLGSPHVEKRGGLLQLKILILNFHLRDYRRVVGPSCHSAQPISCAIWRSTSYLEQFAILWRPSSCEELCFCSQVYEQLFLYRHDKCECLFY